MLQNTKELYGYKLAATDGTIGHVKDFYFDDLSWVIRYLIADTGSWISGRLVLLSPHAFGAIDADEKTLHVKLRKKQIEDSPSPESHQSVSRQYEIEYYRYYGWPAYWEGGAIWGVGGFPVVLPPSPEEIAATNHRIHHRADRHLQSAQAVTGYAIHGIDGEIGTVAGFMVDPKSWEIRQLVVDAGHWFSGKEILLPSKNISRISYEDSTVFADITKSDAEHTADHHLVRAGAKDFVAASLKTRRKTTA